jgi:hypothetical protein
MKHEISTFMCLFTFLTWKNGLKKTHLERGKKRKSWDALATGTFEKSIENDTRIIKSRNQDLVQVHERLMHRMGTIWDLPCWGINEAIVKAAYLKQLTGDSLRGRHLGHPGDHGPFVMPISKDTRYHVPQ